MNQSCHVFRLQWNHKALKITRAINVPILSDFPRLLKAEGLSSTRSTKINLLPISFNK